MEFDPWDKELICRLKTMARNCKSRLPSTSLLDNEDILQEMMEKSLESYQSSYDPYGTSSASSFITRKANWTVANIVRNEWREHNRTPDRISPAEANDGSEEAQEPEEVFISYITPANHHKAKIILNAIREVSQELYLMLRDGVPLDLFQEVKRLQRQDATKRGACVLNYKFRVSKKLFREYFGISIETVYNKIEPIINSDPQTNQ